LALTRWTLDGVGPDGAAIQMRGESSDVLRRQADGRWLVALDNPWGVSLLGGQEPS
jgi:ketosteroid isomerase-like protein